MRTAIGGGGSDSIALRIKAEIVMGVTICAMADELSRKARSQFVRVLVVNATIGHCGSTQMSEEQIRTFEIGTIKVGSFEVGAIEIGTRQVGIPQIGVT